MKEFKPEELIRLVKETNSIDCYDITNEEYWNEEWVMCPICGCQPDEDGHWVHLDKLSINN